MDDMHKCLGRTSPEDQTELGPLWAREKDQTEVVTLRSLVDGQTDMGPLRSRVKDQTRLGPLQARVEEQSGLIGVLKQRSDQARLRCQALQKVNEELEARGAAAQKELDSERARVRLLEKRFNDLAVNHQGIVVFKDDYKRHNFQLLEENKLLRSENEALFSQKLLDQETLIGKLRQDIHLNEEKHEDMEKYLRDQEAEWKAKMLKQKYLTQWQEAAQLKRLHDTQDSLKSAEDMCKDLKHQLQEAADGRALTETEMKQTINSLCAEKDIFINLSVERGKVLQEKQEKIQQLEIKLEEVEKVKTRAENRFKQEAEAVNINVKVMNLQRAFDEAVKKNEKAREVGYNRTTLLFYQGNILYSLESMCVIIP
ncbi:coiled-coil domain-containing protein 89 [Gadus macrocephalus]|uniref:coiled-coil domain-containing protein 89 n=1 Tax=Gadus macrocephalus TaxID=80720 RepID=UPI0028CB9C70|nr:coiled-coil domain-containing protein 89 [Gadus macrocephalus]